AVTDIVEKDCQKYGFFFIFRNLMSFATNNLYGEVHEVHGSQNMMKTGMQCSRIHQVGHAQLFDASQALHVRMFHKIKNELVRNGNETVNGIIEYFLLVVLAHRSCRIVGCPQKYKKQVLDT